jgi:hypothetical protein
MATLTKLASKVINNPANGGKDTLYPEYEETLKKLIADMAAKRVQ